MSDFLALFHFNRKHIDIRAAGDDLAIEIRPWLHTILFEIPDPRHRQRGLLSPHAPVPEPEGRAGAASAPSLIWSTAAGTLVFVADYGTVFRPVAGNARC